jgi:hypothetical protein
LLIKRCGRQSSDITVVNESWSSSPLEITRMHAIVEKFTLITTAIHSLIFPALRSRATIVVNCMFMFQKREKEIIALLTAPVLHVKIYMAELYFQEVFRCSRNDKNANVYFCTL